MVQNMKVTGNKVLLMDLEYYHFQMEASMKGIGIKESTMEKDYIKQEMEQNMMENG